MPTPHQRLTQLLCEVFTPGELRQFITGLPGGRELLFTVLERTTPAQLSNEVVDGLQRRMRLDGDFFEALSQARPYRYRDIVAICEVMGVHSPVQRDLNPLTAAADVFVGQYAHLRALYRSPDPIFRQVNLERFVGRSALTEALQHFLSTASKGCFEVVAGAGLGKTSWMAHIVREHGYLSHFVTRSQGVRSTGAAILNLAAQLSVSWGLSPNLTLGLRPGAYVRPDLLTELLEAAAVRRDRQQPGAPIIVVVDGLDEAESSGSGNVLGLPRSLPDGVYLIVSRRPVLMPLYIDAPRQVVKLEQQDNIAGLRRFFAAALERAEVEGALDDLVEPLVQKSDGVWTYAQFIARDAERLGQAALSPGRLPEGLRALYDDFWTRWKFEHPEAWPRHQKLIAAAAAMQEPCEVSHICLLAGISHEPRDEDLFSRHWRDFFTTNIDGERVCVRIYHASVGKYFQGEDGVGDMHRWGQHCQLAHHTIASRFLEAWGGLTAGLPRLRDAGSLDMTARYGVRQLVAHLKTAERHADIHTLMWLSVPRESTPHVENCWFTVKEVCHDAERYRLDLNLASQLADQLLAQPATRTHGLTLQVRYALLRSTLLSMANHSRPGLGAGLVADGLWSPEQAIHHARSRADPVARATSLVRLLPRLSLPLREQTVSEVVSLLDPRSFAYENTDLILEACAALPAGTALAVARRLASPILRAEALAATGLRLPEVGKQEVSEELWEMALHATALPGAFLKATDGGTPDAEMLFVLAMTSAKDPPAIWAAALRLSPARIDEEMVRHLIAANPNPPIHIRHRAPFIRLLPKLPEAYRGAFTRHLLDSALARPQDWSDAQYAIIAQYTPADQIGRLVDVLAQLSMFSTPFPSKALRALASVLPPQQVNGVLKLVRERIPDHRHPEALASFAAGLRDPAQQKRARLIANAKALRSRWSNPVTRARLAVMMAAGCADSKRREQALLDALKLCKRAVDTRPSSLTPLAEVFPLLSETHRRRVAAWASAKLPDALIPDPVVAEIEPLTRRQEIRWVQLEAERHINDAARCAQAMARLSSGQPQARADALIERLPHSDYDKRLAIAELRAAPSRKGLRHAVSQLSWVAYPFSRFPLFSSLILAAMSSGQPIPHLSDAHARAVRTLVPHLSGWEVVQVSSVLRSSWPSEPRARALLQFRDKLPAWVFRALLHRELKKLTTSQASSAPEAAALIFSAMTHEQQEHALSSAMVRGRHWLRARLLMQAAQQASGERKIALLDDVTACCTARWETSSLPRDEDDRWRNEIASSLGVSGAQIAAVLTAYPQLPASHRRRICAYFGKLERDCADLYPAPLSTPAPVSWLPDPADLHVSEAQLSVPLEELARWRMRTRELCALAPFLSESQASAVFSEICTHSNISLLYELLQRLAVCLPPCELPALLRQAAQYQADYKRRPIYQEVIRRMNAASDEVAVAVWEVVVENLGKVERKLALGDLIDAAPLIDRLGGDSAQQDLFEDIKQVSTCWP